MGRWKSPISLFGVTILYEIDGSKMLNGIHHNEKLYDTCVLLPKSRIRLLWLPKNKMNDICSFSHWAAAPYDDNTILLDSTATTTATIIIMMINQHNHQQTKRTTNLKQLSTLHVWIVIIIIMIRRYLCPHNSDHHGKVSGNNHFSPEKEWFILLERYT